MLAFLFSLALGEILIRLVAPQQLIVTNNRLWKPEPVFGWRHFESADTPVNTGERLTHLVTDEHGYRINRSLTKGEEAGKADISILMIGDSFLEALAIENEETIPQRIKQMLEAKYHKRVRAVNAGVGSWEPGQYWLEARRALALAPYDLGIVFIYIENDIVDKVRTTFSHKEFEKNTTLRLPREWTWNSLISAVFYPINFYLKQRSQLFVFLKERFNILLARMRLTAYYFPVIFERKEKNSKRWEITADVCQKIQQEFEKYSTPVFFVFLPTDYQLDPSALNEYIKMFDISLQSVDLEQPDKMLALSFKKRYLDFIDTLVPMRERVRRGVKMHGQIDSHLNAEGHRAVAEIIFGEVEKYLPPQLKENH